MLNFIGGAGLQSWRLSHHPNSLPSSHHPTPTPHDANTHFNHLDFHYHSFLFSLLNLVPLTTEPWTKINSLPCLHQKIAILAGFEFSFQTQTFDFFFSYSFSQNLPRLIRITLLKERRGSVQSNCSREKWQRGGRLQDESVSLKHWSNFTETGKVWLGGSHLLVSHRNLCLVALNTVCDRARACSFYSSPLHPSHRLFRSCFSAFHI